MGLSNRALQRTRLRAAAERVIVIPTDCFDGSGADAEEDEDAAGSRVSRGDVVSRR
jgi:hypothetical protein